MTPIETLICAALILTSAFMAASEIALFSLSRFQLRSLKESFRSSHRRIKRLLGDPGGLLVTILVVNEILNISLSSLITRTIARSVEHGALPAPLAAVPHWAVDTVLGIAVTAPIVLFLCEITPKVVAAKANSLIATIASGPLTAIYDGFKPVRLALKRLVLLIAGRGRVPSVPADERDGQILRESDFLLMVEEGHKEGAIQESELELIKNVFELDDRTVSDILTPLPQVQSLSMHTTLKGALAALRSLRHSRIPVTSANRKQVVGILYSKDLLQAKLEPGLLTRDISAVMRKPLFVGPSTRLNALFRKFKSQKTHMAIVSAGGAPGGETLGVVTMSDVLDALFEDVLPEEEDEETA